MTEDAAGPPLDASPTHSAMATTRELCSVPLTSRHSNYSWKTFRRQALTSEVLLGSELKKARLAAKLTQEDLAFKAGLSRNYISLLELDQKSPTVNVLLRICKTLGVKPSKVIARIES